MGENVLQFAILDTMKVKDVPMHSRIIRGVLCDGVREGASGVEA